MKQKRTQNFYLFRLKDFLKFLNIKEYYKRDYMLVYVPKFIKAFISKLLYCDKGNIILKCNINIYIMCINKTNF